MFYSDDLEDGDCELDADRLEDERLAAQQAHQPEDHWLDRAMEDRISGGMGDWMDD